MHILSIMAIIPKATFHQSFVRSKPLDLKLKTGNLATIKKLTIKTYIYQYHALCAIALIQLLFSYVKIKGSEMVSKAAAGMGTP